MAENQTLRNLLRSLASFIGDGAGGLLPKLGWDLGDFNDFINKSETDTAWEGYHRRKKQHAAEAEGSNTTSQPQKRSAEDEHTGSRPKKPRGDENDVKDNQNGFSLLVSMPPTIQPPPLYPPTARPDRNGIFNDLMRSNGSQMFMQQSPTSGSTQYNGAGGSNIDGYQPNYLPGVNLNIDQRVSSSTYDSPSSGSHAQQRGQEPADSGASDEIDLEDDPKKTEAYKLIQ